jgi:phosphoenolpyruvate carboxykinase (GTP)
MCTTPNLVIGSTNGVALKLRRWSGATAGEEENSRLLGEECATGMLKKLNPVKRPNCYLALSDPNDVDGEERTLYVPNREAAGPMNNWVAPAEMRATLNASVRWAACAGAPRIVVPFSMGPLGSHIAHIGVELTDSPYVVVSMRIMTRMGRGGVRRAGRRTATSCPACTRWARR